MFAQEATAYVGTVSIPTIMTYDENDPFAVSFTFATDDMTEWTFSRELLSEAFTSNGQPVGAGDVILQLQGTSLVLVLSSESSITMLFVASEVRSFLDHTMTLVPLGGEHVLMDIEAEWENWRDGNSV